MGCGFRVGEGGVGGWCRACHGFVRFVVVLCMGWGGMRPWRGSGGLWRCWGRGRVGGGGWSGLGGG